MIPARAFVIAAVLVLAASARSVEAASDRQVRTFPLPTGRALAIDITVGNVEIEGWSRGDAEVVVTRHVPGNAGFDRLPVEVIEGERSVVVRILQAGGSDPAYRSDIRVRVPRAATLKDVRILEGRLTIASLEGAVTAALQRGDIDARLVTGQLRLETTIGDIRMSGARLTPDGVLRLRAFNGDVRLEFASRPTDVRLLALALNGSITSEIPLTLKDSWGPRFGETTLGRGEPVVSIDVVTGRIEIRVAA